MMINMQSRGSGKQAKPKYAIHACVCVGEGLDSKWTILDG